MCHINCRETLGTKLAVYARLVAEGKCDGMVLCDDDQRHIRPSLIQPKNEDNKTILLLIPVVQLHHRIENLALFNSSRLGPLQR